MPWRRGIRGRLATVIVALVALTAVVLGVGASVVADLRLHAQALDAASAQAGFDLSVTIPERVGDDPTRDDLLQSGIAGSLALRDIDLVVDLGAGGVFASREELADLTARLPDDVRERVDRGELAYAWLDSQLGPSLVVAGHAPAGSDLTAGPVYLFVHDASAIDAALTQLRLALLIGGLLLVLVAFAVARRLARGVLAPVEEASLAAERIAAGDLRTRLGLQSDDELGAMAASFDRMAAALERSQGQQRRFVADVAHELRTPLTALVAEASVVRAGLDDLPPDRRRAAELLVADVGRLRTLVEELLELSRFDAGAERVELQEVPLRQRLESSVAARLPSARIGIAPEIASTLATDPRRLDRILGNLLDNAREHAGGAVVEVVVTPTDIDGEPAVAVTVTDRGPGVPPDRLDRIFERFSKLDPSRSGGSSGLGLAIAAEHAALLGGFLEARDREGGGLAVTLIHPTTVARSLPDGDGTVIPLDEAGRQATSPQESPR